jgi:predicted dehydrogenase
MEQGRGIEHVKDKINLGVIGCGHIAKNVLVLQAAQIKEFRLHAFMDLVEARAEELSRKHRGSYCTPDLDKLANDASLDAVLVCTLPDTHAAIAKRFLEVGKHVFIQKPPAVTYDQCVELVKAERAANGRAMVAYCYRLSPLTHAIRQAIPHPKVLFARMMVKRVSEDNRYYIDHRETGGPMLELACHNVDLVYWLAGSRPVKVSAFGGNLNNPGMSVVDNFVMNIEFENGTVASLVNVDCGSADFGRKWFLEVYGDGITATTDGFKKLIFSGKRDEETTVEYQKGIGLDRDMEAFKECIVTGKDSPIPVREGVVATILILKAFDSIKSGKVEQIDLTQYLS